MRPEIQKIVQLGPLPSEDDADVDMLREYESAYSAIIRPVTDEARALARLFGEDGCFGFSSSILHLIETAPGWPIKDCLSDTRNPWILELRNRAIRGGVL